MSDTTPIAPASEREAFVAWAKKENPGLGMHPHRDGGFLWATTQAMWEAWQARAALSHPSPQGCPVPHDAALNIAGPFNACMFRQHCRAMLAVSPHPPEQGSKG